MRKTTIACLVALLSYPLGTVAQTSPYAQGSISQIEKLTKKQAQYKYGGLGNGARCAQADHDPSIYLCVTQNVSGDTFPNAYLLINMQQKLMFILNKPVGATCSDRPVRIIALYDQSQKLDSTALPESQWGSSFSTMAQEYNYIFGCDASKDSYKFDSAPFGFNMRWRMPWEYNISNPNPLKPI